MTADDILERKGHDIITISSTSTVREASDMLAEKNIGSLVVTTPNEELIGVLSERDIVHALAAEGGNSLHLTVRDIIDQVPETCSPDDDVKDLIAFVTRKRVRHLPVQDDGSLVGIISVGDLLKTRLEEMETEQRVLRDRLMGQ